MRKRATFARVAGMLVPALLGGSCTDFDATRPPPQQGSLGVQLFGVICDRAGGQSLHEDLSGASFHAICHGSSTLVDQTALPAIDGPKPNLRGDMVSVDQQKTDRSYGVARLEALARDRAKLVAAIDAALPDINVDVKDIGNADPTKSCQAAGQNSFHTELANLLARFPSLYDDGTMPASTEALGAVADAFTQSNDATTAWAHFNSRAGYRPSDVALGVSRSLMAYPKLREYVNSVMATLSPDAHPYDPNAKTDANGNRIPQPGALYPQLQALIAATRAEFANSTPDDPLVPLAATQDPMAANRSVLNRPRSDLETLQSLLFASDPSFASGPFASGATAGAPSPKRYIVARDSRGYAVVPPVNGALPAPFMADSTGVPAIDDLGQFLTSGGAAPTPFPLAGGDRASRDPFGLALGPDGQPLYKYIDTSQTVLSVVLGNMRGAVQGASFLDPNHETLMNSVAGAYALFGQRAADASRKYADGSTVKYKGYQPVGSPMGDLVYAFGQVLAVPSADGALALFSQLMSTHQADMARVIGNVLWAKDQSNLDNAAKIPSTSTLWDELIDLFVGIAQDTSIDPATNHRLLEDLLLSTADPKTLGLIQANGTFMNTVDHFTYDRNDLNGAMVNTTAPGKPASVPPDRSKPDTGANRSQFQRMVQLTSDLNGVPTINAEGMIAPANEGPISLPAITIGPLTIGPFPGTNDLTMTVCGTDDPNNPLGPAVACFSDNCSTNCIGNKPRPFHQGELIYFPDTAKEYLHAVVGTSNVYYRNRVIRDGIGGSIGKPGALALTVGVFERSTTLGFGGNADLDKYNDTPSQKTGLDAPGFEDPAGTLWNPLANPPTVLREKPGELARQANFDFAHDSPNPGDKNYVLGQYLKNSFGLHYGTSVCPVRLIPDPCKNDPNQNCFERKEDNNVAPDGMIRVPDCADGDWLDQRDPDGAFILMENGFVDAAVPLAAACVGHGREDVFVRLMATLHKHWQTPAGAAASPNECKLTVDANGKTLSSCTQDGADTYEPLLGKFFASDLFASVQNMTRLIQGMQITTCSKVDPGTHTCTASSTQDGISVLAAFIRDLVDPAVAAKVGLTDSSFMNKTALRNDGTTNPQVTPLYLLLEALNEVDAALTATGDADPNRLTEWRSARSQLVDEMFSVTNPNDATKTQVFNDPSVPVVVTTLLETLRAQLLARCGADVTTGMCVWARGVHPDKACPPGQTMGASGCAVPPALWNEAVATFGGPTFAGAMDLLEGIRNDPKARAAQEDLLKYLIDPTKADQAQQVESLTELLATGHDALQLFIDDKDLVPVYNTLATAFAPPKSNPNGRSALDAATALLARIGGHAYDGKGSANDGQGNEICANEADPNGVLNIAIANLVTPMTTGNVPPDQPTLVGQTPLEVIVDAIADVNRAAPQQTMPSLQATDYVNINKELRDFLIDPTRGLEQFYAIVRHATEHQ